MTGRTALVPLAVAGIGIVVGACSLEVVNPGTILSEDLNTPDLMPVVVNGVSAQFNDVVDDLAYNHGRLTDDMSGTGSYFDTGRRRRGLFDAEDSEGTWEQIHEAIGAAGDAWDRLQLVLEDAAGSNVQSARMFALMGHGHRLLGENFCAVAYNSGPLQPRTAAFDSAIAVFNQAIDIAAAAGAPADEDAQFWADVAQAGLAQAYVGLGMWPEAAAAASVIPTDFVHEAIYNDDANDNIVWEETHGRAELGVWASPAQWYGDPAGTADPRVPYRICGTWDDPSNIPSSVTSTDTCDDSGDGAHQGADGQTAHYRQQKYSEEGDNIPVATGTEMRLIQAEAALRAGAPMATFLGFINEVRAHHGLLGYGEAGGPAAPTTAGALEWPNAMDGQARSGFPTGGNPALEDAWSVLDRERYMTLWIEGRRMFDLNRWEHPFLQGGTLIGAGENPRVSCMPIPRIECTLNENLAGSDACS